MKLQNVSYDAHDIIHINFLLNHTIFDTRTIFKNILKHYSLRNIKYYCICREAYRIQFNCLLWQLIADITSDQTVYNNSSLSFSFELVGMISLDRNYWEVINLLSVLPGLYFNILKTEEILEFLGQEDSRRAWHVIPAQEINLRKFFARDIVPPYRSKDLSVSRHNVLSSHQNFTYF